MGKRVHLYSSIFLLSFLVAFQTYGVGAALSLDKECGDINCQGESSVLIVIELRD
jgi:hypothetical protein